MKDASPPEPVDFGPYTLLRELGRGGQGTVWLAEDHRLKRRVALKVLGTAPGALSEDRLSRFSREAEAAARLDDAHICALLDAGDVGGVPYLAFRYVEGQTLAERIARTYAEREGVVEGATDDATTDPGSRAGIQRIVRVFEKVARALHKAHERGLIHRDVKPGNIMITPDGEPVLLDFGLARDELAEELSLTHSGDLLGTPAYMSPEQLTAHRIPLDRRTDVYSLGATLYEALTLQKPFSAPTRAGLYQQILTAEPSSASGHNAQIPRDLQVVLETAMEKDRGRRYQTAADFADDLRRFREFEPIQAKPIGAFLRFRRWTQRRPAQATAVVGAFAVLAVALAVALWFLGEVNRELVRRRALGLAHAASEAADSDQSLALLLALRAVETQRLPETLAELHEAFGASYERLILRPESAATAATFSPDGTQFLTAHADGTVRFWSLDGEEVRPRIVHPDRVHSAAFRADGRRIVTACRDGEVRFWDLDGRQVGGFSGRSGGQHVTKFTPDGLFVLTAFGETAQIRDLDGRVDVEFDGHEGRVYWADLSADGTRVITMSEDGFARVWDRETGRCESILESECEEVGSRGVVSPSGRSVATGALEGIVRLWTPDGTLLATMPGQGGGVRSLAFSADERFLFVGSSAATVRMFDLSGNLVAVFRGHEGPVVGSELDASGQRLLTLSPSSVRLWDVRVSDAPVLTGHERVVRSVVYSADGRRLLTGSDDCTVRTWGADGALQSSWRTARDTNVFYAELSPDGKWIATADSSARTATVWTPAGAELAQMVGHEGEVRVASFSTDGLRLLTAGTDGTARIWDLHGALIQTLASGEGILQFAAWSASNDRVVTASLDGTARVFDVRSGTLEQSHVHPTAVLSAVFTADDRVLTACGDGIARLWALDGGSAPVREYSGHEAALLFAAASPDGTKVLTASRDKTARLWDLQTGELITVLKGHDGILWRCAFSPDGRRMATASWDRTARVWITDPDELVRLARARVIRDFTPAERERFRDLLGN